MHRYLSADINPSRSQTKTGQINTRESERAGDDVYHRITSATNPPVVVNSESDASGAESERVCDLFSRWIHLDGKSIVAKYCAAVVYWINGVI